MRRLAHLLPEEPLFIEVPWLHVTAMTLWFLVIHQGPLSRVTARHETIHYLQYRELWVVGFLVLYLWDFLHAFVYKGLPFWKAYRRIRFEQEAYDNEYDGDYLDNRLPFAWKKYRV